jgi:DNA invertase Pin-like site-specific DNA recombinase
MSNGQQVGYKRVSTQLQDTTRQLEWETLDRVFEDKLSGKDTNRPQLQELIQFVRDGDTVVVHSMDRLARNVVDLMNLVETLTVKGVKVRFLKENLTFSGNDDPFSQLMLGVLGSVSAFERNILKQRQSEGIEIAKRNGRFKGRKKGSTKVDSKEVLSRISNGETVTSISKDLGVSRPTIYNYINSSKSIS